jgi:hypothetical protein
MWLNGQWLEEEPISVNQPIEFSLNPSVTCDSAGALYCAWEYWGSGKPQQWFSTRTNPHLVIAPASISRTVWIGQNLPNEAITLTNGGPGTVNYSASDNVDWLSLSGASGSATFTQEPTVAVVYNVAGLHRGMHNASITITAGGISGSPRVIPVSVQVLSVKPDFNGDGDVDQHDFGHLQQCFTGAAVPQNRPECAGAKLDNDDDVDANDFAIFQACMSGAGIIANPNCAP